MTDNIGMLLTGVLYVAIVYVLVRPSSKGPGLVGTILGTFSDLVRGTTGQTWDASTNSWSTGSGS